MVTKNFKIFMKKQHKTFKVVNDNIHISCGKLFITNNITYFELKPFSKLFL